MSDLSRLLEDVYRSGGPAPTPTPEPAWASDRALDEAFADWVPGPPPDAPREERVYANTPDAASELAAALEADVQPEREQVDKYAALQALLDEAIRLAPDVVDEPEVVDEPQVTEQSELTDEPEAGDEPLVLAALEALEVVTETPLLVSAGREPAFVPPTPVPGWTLTDDDILPSGTGRRGLFRRR